MEEPMKRIVLDISDEGEVSIETVGFSGKDCLKESEFIKDILGQETFRKLTPAYYSNERTRRYLKLCG
jgi:hypothetical protein